MIKNASIVEDIYGYWPTFHDAEIISINFQRNCSIDPKGASVEIVLNYWETKTINEGTPNLDYVLDKNNLISLRLDGLLDSTVIGFNFQNVIDELQIVEGENGIKVDAISIHGADMSFTCSAISVTSMQPYT